MCAAMGNDAARDKQDNRMCYMHLQASVRGSAKGSMTESTRGMSLSKISCA